MRFQAISHPQFYNSCNDSQSSNNDKFSMMMIIIIIISVILSFLIFVSKFRRKIT